MLAGGIPELVAKADSALEAGNLEWALRLADDVLVLDPENSAAFETKKAAMLALAEGTMNSQARNMLLSDYLLLTGQTPKAFPFGDPKAAFSRMDNHTVLLMPMDILHRIMAVSLNASKSIETDRVVDLKLTDIHKNGRAAHYTLAIRKGILEVDPPSASKGEFVITTDSLSWKELVLGKLDPEAAVTNRDVVISGATPESFYAFMDLFE